MGSSEKKFFFFLFIIYLFPRYMIPVERFFDGGSFRFAFLAAAALWRVFTSVTKIFESSFEEVKIRILQLFLRFERDTRREFLVQEVNSQFFLSVIE